jgi:uncharacterized DUF497 family protein
VGINYHFEWDPKKAQSNRERHGISFDEAATIFLDPLAITIYDPDHSETEERWITMGISKKGRLLIVCHTFHRQNAESSIIRVISSRKANKIETQEYGEK